MTDDNFPLHQYCSPPKSLSIVGRVKRARHENFPHGNYPTYYQYRRAASSASILDIDPRLQALDLALQKATEHGLEHYLNNQVCLDVGCNTGAISRDLACHFKARRVVGVDIDPTLITKAIRSIPPTHKSAFSYIVGDYVTADEANRLNVGNYKVIFCLSVTKWIHLNGGDEAIKRLFIRMVTELKEDGLLILEPQQWSTYARKKNLTPEISNHYSKIELKPEDFVPFLVDSLGLTLVYTALPHSEATITKGFQRPLYILKKCKVDYYSVDS